METLLFKPLVSFENRNERKKVGTYLIVTMFVLQLINLGIIRSLTFALIMFGMYKIAINGLSVAFNKERKIIFADEEWLSVIVISIICIAFNYQLFKYLNIFGIGISEIYILFLTIVASISVAKRGGMLAFLSLGIGYILVRNVSGYNELAVINYKMMYVTIFTLILAIILQFKKKYMLSALWIINLIVFTTMYYDMGTYMYILLPSIIVSIMVLREGNFDFSKILNSEFLLGDGSERRLKPASEEKKNDCLEQNLTDEEFVKKKYIREKIEAEENIREFEEKIILDKKIKKLKIYNQIVYFDKIIKNIYLECIKNDINLNIYEICDILNMNNLVVDIEDKEVSKELKVLRDVSIKTISNMNKKLEKEYEGNKEKIENDIKKEDEKEELEEEQQEQQEEIKTTIVSKIVEINKKTIKSIREKLLRE